MSLEYRSGRRIGAGLVVIGVLLLVSGMSLAAVATPSENVQICHFEGHRGSSESHTIEVAPGAVSAHLASGFDYLGPCLPPSNGSTSTTDAQTSTTVASSSTTVASTSTSTVGSAPTTQALTSTTVASTSTTQALTSTTVASTSTTQALTSTTVASTSTSTVALAPTTAERTPTTVASTSTTTSEAEADVDAVASEQTTSTTAAVDTAAAVDAANELPFTGMNMLLVIPGALLALIGAFAVFVTGGLGHASAAHVASGAEGFALGLHRGRHQA